MSLIELSCRAKNSNNANKATDKKILPALGSPPQPGAPARMVPGWDKLYQYICTYKYKYILYVDILCHISTHIFYNHWLPPVPWQPPPPPPRCARLFEDGRCKIRKWSNGHVHLCNININFDIRSITIIIILCHAGLWGHSSHNIPNEAKVTKCPKENPLPPYLCFHFSLQRDGGLNVEI